MHSVNIKTLGKEPVFGSEAEKLRPVKLRDGSVTFNRVGDPNQSVSDGPDRMSARSNGQCASGRRGPIRYPAFGAGFVYIDKKKE